MCFKLIIKIVSDSLKYIYMYALNLGNYNYILLFAENIKKKKTFQSEPICFLATPEANLIS